MITRREALKHALFGTAAIAVTSLASHTDADPTTPATLPKADPSPVAPTAGIAGPFTVPPLPYAYDALEPYIDAQTMMLHHDKHHAAYVKNLNTALADYPLLQDKTVEQLLSHLLSEKPAPMTALPDKIRTTVRNNGGGHYNHSLFWQLMKKDGGGTPSGDIAAAIDKQFGSFTSFQEQLTKAALGQFGSGWAWLSKNPDGSLLIEPLPNQDSPVMYGRTPILGIDIWEHAYYLKYQNKRADYVKAWFNTVNWDMAANRFSGRSGTVPGTTPLPPLAVPNTMPQGGDNGTPPPPPPI